MKKNMSKIILEDLKFKKITKKIIIKDNKKEINDEDIKIDKYISKIKKRERIQSFPEIKEKKRGLSKSLSLLFIFMFSLGIMFWASEYFYNASIHITKRNENLILKDKKFILSGDDESKINFEVMIVTGEEKKNIELSEKENVSIKAKGEVVFYNEFATTSQKLLAGTFLVDENGKTYKTDNTVIIPGYKIVNGKKVLGEVSTPITSFLAGESYNGSPKKFYISEFKGMDKYSKIYANLKSPLVGGISGEAYKIGSVNEDNLKIFANSTLKNVLEKKLKAEIPEGYIYYQGASSFSYNTDTIGYSKDPKASVLLSGSLTAILIEEKDLKNNLIKLFSVDIKDKEINQIDITNIKDLKFNFYESDQLVHKEINNVEFLLNGNVNLLWNPDISFLKSKLVNLKKIDANSVFLLDPGVSHASLSVFPPWKKLLPEDKDKIKITID
ncbi:TPA: hypothetical protein DIC38_02375 [Candidatus Nomurabacteria bacterium]|nr:MAG: hypothetical protein O210_OD1C00001G0256 [Parcubacteria bacterium RAAC4_OD1_1]HCY26500.1 hypothetical protein [Candidatus Nomurabacteria bacterium]